MTTASPMAKKMVDDLHEISELKIKISKLELQINAYIKAFDTEKYRELLQEIDRLKLENANYKLGCEMIRDITEPQNG